METTKKITKLQEEAFLAGRRMENLEWTLLVAALLKALHGMDLEALMHSTEAIRVKADLVNKDLKEPTK